MAGSARQLLIGSLTAVVLTSTIPARAVDWDLRSDTWVAVDALGRKLPGYAECGPPRQNRAVGIFYFLWLGQHGTSGPYDITKLLAANPTDPAWGPVNAFHHWNESELGYYLSDDEWVIRRHCSMLADAGVDVLIFDVTNGFPYTSNYLLVCEVMTQMRALGLRTPQICFLVNPDDNTLAQTLYNDLYAPNNYPDLWFRWQGKPLMLTRPDGLPQAIQDFFTFRRTWAWNAGQDNWTWLDHTPQQVGWHTPGVNEELSICVAEHPTSNIGRSYQNGTQPDPSGFRSAEGLHFAEQWQRAKQVDPEFLFITGWNEWVAQRFLSNGSNWFLGQQLPAGETYFVDTYSQEYSRDIEPMKGGHTDSYYYQMVDYIRRYKGVRAPEVPTSPKTITMDGSFADWTDVGPVFADTIGDTAARNHPGWGSAGTYTNTTGRNDFVTLKVTRDASNVYFYAETQASITSRAGANWMLLFIDSDSDNTTGWQGYDYLVNSTVTSSTATTLKHTTGGWNWTTVGSLSYRRTGNKIEIAIPRAGIGQANIDVRLDFHWADNIQRNDDITEFSVSGDSAPNRRFNYRYNTDFTPPGPLVGFTAARANTQAVLSWTNPADADLADVMIRYRTDRYPVDAADGELVCDRTAWPGASETVTHTDLQRAATYYYAAFVSDRVPNQTIGGTAAIPALAPVDFDADGDVDQEDFGCFQACLTGTGTSNRVLACSEVDFDHDTDIDSADCQRVLACMQGPGVIVSNCPE